MSDRNSDVVPQIRPEQAMEQLGLKRDAYYADLKFLGIKAQKDSEGKSFLEEGEFQLLVALRKHVEETGKREGFQIPGELATLDAGAIAGPEAEQLFPDDRPQPEQFDMAALVAEANALAVNRMTMREQLVSAMVKDRPLRAIANQMTFDDLTPEAQAQVLNLREQVKKPQPQQVATALLNQWRQQRPPQQPDQAAVSAA